MILFPVSAIARRNRRFGRDRERPGILGYKAVHERGLAPEP